MSVDSCDTKEEAPQSFSRRKIELVASMMAQKYPNGEQRDALIRFAEEEACIAPDEIVILICGAVNKGFDASPNQLGNNARSIVREYVRQLTPFETRGEARKTLV